MRTSCAALLVCSALASPVLAQPHLLVLNKDDATLAIVDASSGTVLRSVPTGDAPHEVAVSDDGRWAFAANYGDQTPGSSISMIDLQSAREVRRIDVTPLRRPHGLAFHDGKLYFTSETNRIVARYDPASNRIDWLIGTGQAGTHMVWVSRDGARLAACNIGSNSMTIFDRGSNPLAWNVTVVPVGWGPEGFDVSPDERELWAAHSQDGGVSIVDLATRKVTATFDAQTKRSNRLKFTRDGKQVLISDVDSGDIVVVDAQSHAIIRRVALGREPEGILIAPDGATAYVAVAGDNAIAVLDLTSWTLTRRIQTGHGPDGMAYVGGR
jgi:YVTN family beta-propeller protein